MLRELTKSDWMSMLKIPLDRVPTALILWGTRNLKSRYATIKRSFDDVIEIGSPNGIIEDVLIGDIDGTVTAYGSVYGAPMASEITHIFGILGTPLVIQIGTCGGLADKLEAGDLFIVESAYCGEGASQYYKSDGKQVSATIEFDEVVRGGHASLAVRNGQIYSTSALFAEGKEEIENWANQGYSAVDMETAATFAVAEHFGMDRGSILVVFDNPRKQEHIMITDSEKADRRDTAQKLMLETAFETVRKYKSKGT